MALALSGSVARTLRFSSLRPTPGGPGNGGDGEDRDDQDDHVGHDDNSPMRMISLYLPVRGKRRSPLDQSHRSK